MKKKLLLFVYTCLFILMDASLVAQDNSHLRISLLTCTPGNELYSTFGHSALRITDSSSLQDIVFNYGTFNFEEPGFYTKFIRGKLRYFVSSTTFPYFVEEYQLSDRGITEQVLNLTAAEKIAIQRFVYNNIREENKYYQYDFLFDNCTTRLRDIIAQSKPAPPAFQYTMPAGTTFREAIHRYLDSNRQDWSKLGIDLLLGAPTDAVMTISQSQFLPDNLMYSLDRIEAPEQLVISKSSLYPFAPPAVSKPLLTPVLLFSLLLLIVAAADLLQSRKTTALLHGFDGLLFFITGAVGCLLLFMWLGTDHAMCKNNYNLLWAWPTHLLLSFFINSKKKWVKKYLLVTIVAMSIVMAGWFFLPQKLNVAFFLYSCLLVYRAARSYFI